MADELVILRSKFPTNSNGSYSIVTNGNNTTYYEDVPGFYYEIYFTNFRGPAMYQPDYLADLYLRAVCIGAKHEATASISFSSVVSYSFDWNDQLREYQNSLVTCHVHGGTYTAGLSAKMPDRVAIELKRPAPGAPVFNGQTELCLQKDVWLATPDDGCYNYCCWEVTAKYMNHNGYYDYPFDDTRQSPNVCVWSTKDILEFIPEPEEPDEPEEPEESGIYIYDANNKCWNKYIPFIYTGQGGWNQYKVFIYDANTKSWTECV